MAPRTSRQKTPPQPGSPQPGARGLSRETDDVWDTFRKTGSPKARDALIERYLPLVGLVARRVAAALPGSVQFDDLVGAGCFGLIDAIKRFDPAVGARFETYCSVRVRGAMLDELRHAAWKPRSRVAGQVGEAKEAMRSRLGRTPTFAELARVTGLSLEQVRRASRRSVSHLSLTGQVADEVGEDMRPINILEADGTWDPAALLQEKERRATLEEEVRRLPGPERHVVILYYYEGLTMKQIGRVLKVSESRVCQMHSDILGRLHQRLNEFDDTRPGAAPCDAGGGQGG
jgi:RNA polymerase sigma factor for flagellar operon FliA